MHAKLKDLLERFDNSVLGGVLTLLVIVGCFWLFWASTPSGLEPTQEQRDLQDFLSAQPQLIRTQTTLRTRGQLQDGHEIR